MESALPSDLAISRQSLTSAVADKLLRQHIQYAGQSLKHALQERRTSLESY